MRVQQQSWSHRIWNFASRGAILLCAALAVGALLCVPGLARAEELFIGDEDGIEVVGAVEAASTTEAVVELPSIATPGGQSNEDLAAGYIEQRFGEELPGNDEPSAEVQSAGSYLTGNTAVVYNVLKPVIAQVAAGERTSTQVTVPVSSFEGKTAWTASDLGVSAIVSGGSITQEASDAFNQKVDALIDYGTAMDALAADCPYELYWYNKTVGIVMSIAMSGNPNQLSLVSVQFSLAVATEYEAGEYKANTNLGTTVKNAVATATSIANAHKNKTPYQMLSAYKEKICDLASYNKPASQGKVSYGNPWQLVWVFDQDPNTTVVCEGYAKAFKYLCDLSGRTDVECILVTGDMVEKKGSKGEHMWNVVRMPNNKNYLVDVTNCDGEQGGTTSIGYPNRLFLAPCTGGGYANGYSFAVRNSSGTEWYTYDQDTLAVFPANDLKISSVAYDGPDAPKDISGASVAVANKTYTGKALKPAPTVKLGGATLVAGTDYGVSYKNNVNVGTATVQIAGKGNYQGIATKTFTIAKAASSIKLAAQSKTYTGKALAYTGKVTKSGSAGKVTYKYFLDAKCTKVVKAANVKPAGVYYVKATLAADANHKAATSAAAKLTVNKAAQPMVAKAVARSAKLATVKKQATVVKCPVAVAKQQGKLSYAKASGSSSRLSIHATTGKVTIKKGTKKGTYTIKVKVKAAGNANYKAGSKTVTCKVVVA